MPVVVLQAVVVVIDPQPQGAASGSSAVFEVGDSLKLLVAFASQHTGKQASRLDFADLDAPLIGAFLDHLEHDRSASTRTRNARLAAIRSLFRLAALRHPEHAGLIQRVLAIPSKRHDRTDVCFLTKQETEALLAAPDRSTRTGRRDHALLVLAAQTGLRVSELTSLRRRALKLEASPHLICTGKGRKERACPLTRQTVKVMTAWLREVPPGEDTPLVPGPRGGTLSRDAIRRLVTGHLQTAATGCPSLQDKHITPHTLRHTCAMSLLHAGVDLSTIALWLGHEQITTVQIYLHADLALKEQALAKTNSPQTRPGRYHAPDTLIAFLDSL